MMPKLKTTLTIYCAPQYTNSLDLSLPIDDLQYTFDRILESGIAPSRANRSWHDEREVTGVDDIDLGGGTLFDAFGVPLVLATVKLIFIRNLSEVGTLVIGSAAAREWFEPFGGAGDTINIPPLSSHLLTNLVDGWEVVPGATDRLRIDSGGDTVDYDILVIGTHCEYTSTTTLPPTTTTPGP